VLAVLLVAADRIALVASEGAAATTLQKSQHLQHRPGVSIAGFPFLTQLASGNFDRIKVTATDVPVGNGTDLRINRLDVTLRHVHVARDLSSATSQFGTATALIDYADLSRTLSATFSYAGNGRIRASVGAGAIPGVPVGGSATAAVRLSGEALTFQDPQVTIAGQDVPSAATDYFTTLLGASIPLTGLPFGVHVRSVAAGANGIAITLTATGLTYRR
jgi:hypothetical protein